jgi:hypothetical protein
MQDFDSWDETEVRSKRISKKTKLNKHRYCKKNKINGGLYGPHTYGPAGKTCIKCGHIKKEGQNNEFGKSD